MSVRGFRIKDPGSAITHFIGSAMALILAAPLLIRASYTHEMTTVISLAVFIASMFVLYTASTVYHTFDINKKVNLRLKKFDHMSIYILIAGSYTPICLVILGKQKGIGMLILIWSMALLGIFFTAFFVTCPKWLSSIIYIVMGWTCVLAFGSIFNALSADAFGWLLAGGLIYTIGGVIYALKLPIFNNKHKNFGSHEIFHLFCLGGSLCHFILMYSFVARL